MVIVTWPVLNSIYFFLYKKWYFDLIYNNLFVFPLLSSFYTLTFKLIDRGWVEFFGPLTIVRFTNKLSSLLSSFQTGFIYNYVFIMLLGIIFFLQFILGGLTHGFSDFFNENLLICIFSVILFLIFKDKR